MVAPLSIRAERVCWSWRPVGHISMLILSLFFGSMVRKKNLAGVIERGALLRRCGGEYGCIEMVRIHWEVATAGWSKFVASSIGRMSYQF